MTIYIRAYQQRGADKAVVQFRRYDCGRLQKQRRVVVSRARLEAYKAILLMRGWQVTYSLNKAGEWGARKITDNKGDNNGIR